MQKFTQLTAIAAPLDIPNINTDAIVPVRWLNSTSVNLGDKLFANWRYHEDVEENASFVLNKAPFRQAQIIVAGPNFGCGSSREHAVWALVKFGIRAVIAPSFGDIFYDNAFKNGLLPIRIPAGDNEALLAALQGAADPKLTIDLERCTIAGPNNRAIDFSIAPERRRLLLTGTDEIDILLGHQAAVARFEQADANDRPWVYLPPRG